WSSGVFCTLGRLAPSYTFRSTTSSSTCASPACSPSSASRSEPAPRARSSRQHQSDHRRFPPIDESAVHGDGAVDQRADEVVLQVRGARDTANEYLAAPAREG